MVKEPFSIALKEVCDRVNNTNLIKSVLTILEDDSDNIDYSGFPYQYCASILHNIYVSPNPQIRGSVLRIICNIELNSDNSIICKYNFDKLIAQAIDQKTQDVIQKVDEEKVAAFRCVSVLIKYRRILPISIIRALISLYTTPKHPYKPLVLSYLCEAIVHCHNMDDVPEISTIVVDALTDSSNSFLIDFIGYCFEKQLCIVRQKQFLGKLLSPLSHIRNDTTSILPSVAIITKLLRTWPGLLYFGIHMGALDDLVKCLFRETTNVINIIKGLFKPPATQNSILIPFNGLLLNQLFEKGFIFQLNEITKEQPMFSKHLDEFMSYSNHFNPDHIYKSTISTNSESTTSIIYDIYNSLSSPSLPNNFIQSINASTDDSQLDWDTIQLLLTSVLPHNNIDELNSQTKHFIIRLLDYFSTTFFQLKEIQMKSKTSNCLLSLIRFLLDVKWGVSLLGSSTQMKNATTYVLTSIRKNNIIDDNSQIWSFFHALSLIIADVKGTEVLSELGMMEQILNLSNSITELSNAQKMFSYLSFSPEPTVTFGIFSKFLSTTNEQMFLCAHKEFRVKFLKALEFSNERFKLFLYRYMLSIEQKPTQINYTLNMFCDFMANQPQLIKLIAKEDLIKTFLYQNSRIIYSLLFSNEELLPKLNVDEEIKYWINNCNIEYLNTFDTAIKIAFEELNNDEYIMSQPSILKENGHPRIPPHLFGELVKTKVGAEKLYPFLPTVLNKLQSSSITEKRSVFLALAHFASSDITLDKCIELKIVEKLIEVANSTSSFILKGTLLQCLTMIKTNTKIMDILRNNGFDIFKFGKFNSIVPKNISIFFNKLKKNKTLKIEIQNLNEFGNKVSALLNPLLNKNIKNELIEKYKSNPKEIATIENANIIHELIGVFNYDEKIRSFLYMLCKGVPLLELSHEKVDKRIQCETYEKIELFKTHSELELESSFINLDLKKFDLKKLNPKPKFPEVFIGDEMFERICGITKDQFYESDEDTQMDLRDKIYQSIQ